MNIRKREDADPADGVYKYGDVEFADPVNKKYPIDTPEHVRASWAGIHITENAVFYSFAEVELIKDRIIEAAERFDMRLSEELVERDAKLFTAGDYPDRGIEITSDDLDRMVSNHNPAPIKIEHTDSPLELGMVTRLWRVGKDLFGRLTFTPEAWALIQSSGAKKLSAAVKRDKSGIAEVSIVKHPRVAGAAVFGGDAVEFQSEINGGEDMSETKTAEFSKRISDLERELKSREVDSRIDALKRAGKLAPASEGLARAMLLAGDSEVVTFADGAEKPVAETFLAFLEAQPKVIEFSELADGTKESIELTEAEREVYSKLGLTPEAVVKHKGR